LITHRDLHADVVGAGRSTEFPQQEQPKKQTAHGEFLEVGAE
jgi:hypothetical protein